MRERKAESKGRERQRGSNQSYAPKPPGASEEERVEHPPWEDSVDVEGSSLQSRNFTNAITQDMQHSRREEAHPIAPAPLGHEAEF